MPTDVTCLGEALIDFVATTADVTVGEAEGFVKAPGGAPANVAVGVARLGGNVAFLGKVGEDPFGRFLEKTFSSAGVDTGGMRFSPEYRTSLAFVSRQKNGERSFCFFRNPGADMTYTPEELDGEKLVTQAFHFGSITLIDEPSRQTTLSALKIAKENGALISFDPNLRPALWKSLETAQATILEQLPHVDLLKVSAEELHFLFKGRLPTEEPERKFLRRGIKELRKLFPNLALIVVTQGAEGCLWQREDCFGNMQGLKVNAIDTTGAGDGFVAGLLTSLREQNLLTLEALSKTDSANLHHAVQFANKVGAFTTTRLGAIPSLPTRAELDAFFS